MRKQSTFQWTSKMVWGAVFCHCMLLFAAGVYADPGIKRAPVKTGDSAAITDKTGFKSLFSAAYYDPSKPYIAQLNPRAIPFVQGYMRDHGAYLEKMRFWGKPYFDVYDGILSQYNLPKELKYLSVIESALHPGAVSWAGAVGPWQLMDFEARRMGLRVNRNIDERTDFYKSTHAAAKLLKELHQKFNDWTLVIAAYNCGAGRVKQAIARSGSRDFWDLQYYLPEETRNHVKRFISTHYILEGCAGLTTMTAAELLKFNAANQAADSKLLTDSTVKHISISGKYKGNVIAKNLEMSSVDFFKLNPNFDRIVASGTPYNLTLPLDKAELFEKGRQTILSESIQAFLSN